MIGIAFLIYFMGMGKKAALVAIATVILSCILLPAGIQAYYKTVSGIDFEGAPMKLSIAMGLQETDTNDSQRGNGWYNGFNFDTFEASGFDPELAEQIGNDSIRQSLQIYWNDPAQGARFWWGKYVSQWADPLFESVWNGPLEDDYHNNT